MNIFVTNNCPIKSAQILDDKRLIKMVLESAQILSTAIFLNSNIKYNCLYKPTHVRHPCVLWASRNRSNWQWLYEHFIALCDEYTLRYGKIHKSKGLSFDLLRYAEIHINNATIEVFPNCTRMINIGVNFSNIDDVCQAYRNYLCLKWKHDIIKPKWTKRDIHVWFIHIYLF